jgi:hypothetical protein
MGTHWKQKNKQQNPALPQTQKKKKNLGHLECMLSLLIGCMQILFLKISFYHFHLRV